MTLAERSELVLAFARVLHVNGQSTSRTLAAAERLGRTLGLRARIVPRWGELRLESEDAGVRFVAGVAADPTGVHMGRVASAMTAVDDLAAGRLTPKDAAAAIGSISKAPPTPTWLFALAAAAGAVALSVIFGATHAELVAASDRRVPMHDPRAGAARAQWRAGPL